MKYCPALLLIMIIISLTASAQKRISLIDPLATKETRALAGNLLRLSKNSILFGHQHATEYGHGWQGDADRSDVKTVTGSHPAVIGVDISGLSGRPKDEIEKNKADLVKNITDTYNRGGLSTISWHFSNPASGGGFYWKDSVSLPAVPLIIPGGSHHHQYKDILATIADMAKSLKGKDGSLAPVIFRPYHEFDGDWFWWGSKHCTKEDFITLWQFTVSYLRDTLGVHNFIYAFSPDNKFNTESEFLERYPGDQWVDLVGMDNYGDFGRDGKYDLLSGIKKLRIVSEYAQKAGKLAAFTETGLESIPNPKWFTDVLLRTVITNGLKLAYVLVWRNDATSATHYYAPFPGHPSEADFKLFYDHPFTLFEKDLKALYK